MIFIRDYGKLLDKTFNTNKKGVMEEFTKVIDVNEKLCIRDINCFVVAEEENGFVAVPYLLWGDSVLDKENGDIRCDGGYRHYLRISIENNLYVYDIVKVDDSYSNIGHWNLKSTIRVDEFMANYCLNTFKQGYDVYKEFQKNLRLKDIENIMNKHNISLKGIKEYSSSIE